MNKKFIIALLISVGLLGSLLPSKVTYAGLVLDEQQSTYTGSIYGVQYNGVQCTKYKSFVLAEVQPNGSILGGYNWVYKIPTETGYVETLDLETVDEDLLINGFENIPNVWNRSFNPGDVFIIDDADRFSAEGEITSYYPSEVESKLPTLLSVDTPSNGGTILNSVNIAGWALNSSGVKQIDILVDGAEKGTAALGISRPDVNTAFGAYNNQNSGYSYNLDTSNLTHGKHTLTVKVTGNDGSVSTQNINLVRPDSITHIDTPHGTVKGNSVNVGGWALNPSGVKEVHILVDGTEKGTAQLGISRPDVKNVFPVYNTVNSGYNYSLDLSSINGGNHTVTVKAIGNDGIVDTNSTNINVDKPQQLLCVDTPNNGGTILNSVNIGGWALNTSGVKQIDILVDGVEKGTATLGISRQDVNTVFPAYNNQNSGYSYNLDTSNLTCGKHTLTVKVTGNDGVVSTQNINLVRPDAITNIDTPHGTVKGNSVNVGGWALNPSGVKEVHILVDETEKGTAQLGISRPDVKNAFPVYNTVNSGYNYNLDINSVSGGNHTVTVKAIGNDGTVDTKSTNINVDKPQQLLCVDTPSNGGTILNSVNISGWTLNVSGTKQVDIFVDGTEKGTATIGQARIDVANVFPAYNNRNSGFSYNLDTSNLTHGKHTLTVKVTGNDGSVSIQNINLVRPDAITHIDTPHGTVEGNSVNVGGWALNPSGVKEVHILVDGEEKGTAQLGISRPDVKNVFPVYNTVNSGYNYNLDISSLVNGSYTITVKAIGNDGSIDTSSTIIKK